MAWKKPRVIPVEVYDIEVELYDSIKLCLRWTKDYRVGVNKEDIDGAAGLTSALVRRDGIVTLAMCIPPQPHRGTLLAHEVAHCAHMILDSRGVPISLENTEASAYLQDFLFNRAAKLLGMDT